MDIRYIESDRMIVQGKRDEIYKRYGKSYNIKPLGNGNGNWLLTRPSDVLVDGKSCRNFILEHYPNNGRLTRNLFKMFCDDLKNGNITLQQIA